MGRERTCSFFRILIVAFHLFPTPGGGGALTQFPNHVGHSLTLRLSLANLIPIIKHKKLLLKCLKKTAT